MFYQRRKIPGIYYITYTISFILENATAQNRYTQDSWSEVGGLKVSPKNSCQLASHRVCLSATLSITFYHFNNLEGFELTHLAMLDICPRISRLRLFCVEVLRWEIWNWIHGPRHKVLTVILFSFCFVGLWRYLEFLTRLQPPFTYLWKVNDSIAFLVQLALDIYFREKHYIIQCWRAQL